MIIEGHRKLVLTYHVKPQAINFITVHVFIYRHISAGDCHSREKEIHYQPLSHVQ